MLLAAIDLLFIFFIFLPLFFIKIFSPKTNATVEFKLVYFISAVVLLLLNVIRYSTGQGTDMTVITVILWGILSLLTFAELMFKIYQS